MKGKAIYKPKGKAGEYSEWACNIFTGCSNDCDYCYCKKGLLSSFWTDSPKLKKCFKSEEAALITLAKELEANQKELRLKGLFFSFTTDPLVKATRHLHTECFLLCMKYGIRVSFLTKDATFVDDPEFFINKGILNDATLSNWLDFGFTLTGHNELEPYASTNEQRIAAMKKLSVRGYNTFASIEPVVDAAASMSMIEQTRGYCDLYKIGLMSGKRYTDDEKMHIKGMIEILKSRTDMRIYLKESVVNMFGIDRNELPPHFVSRNFRLLPKNIMCHARVESVTPPDTED